MDQLFTDAGRAAPEDVVVAFDIPGCQYGFVHAALHNPALVAPTIPPSPDLMFQTVGRFMSRLPPERHRAMRSRFAGLFTPRRVERYRGRIVERVDDLLSALPVTGSVDLVEAFARPLPFAVIADVLGVPPDRQEWLAAAMETFGRAVARQRDHDQVELGNAAVAEMLGLFDELIRERTSRPREDLLTLLASQPSDGESRQEILANCLFFILAGHVTTTGLISAGVQVLIDYPDQLRQLTEHPDQWPLAVEELLRFVTPTTLTGTTAITDTEVDGCLVPAGTQRTLVFTAANRDPSVFHDPANFEATRAPNPHLAFSAGAHYCLGAPLARLHGEIALAALFDRFPGLRLDASPVWVGSVPVRQIQTLRVAW